MEEDFALLCLYVHTDMRLPHVDIIYIELLFRHLKQTVVLFRFHRNVCMIFSTAVFQLHDIHLTCGFLSSTTPATVKIGDTPSSSTSEPPRVVFSVFFLYTLYTSDCISPSSIIARRRYSDDSGIVALLRDKDSSLIFRTTVHGHVPPSECKKKKSKEPVFKTPNLGPFLSKTVERVCKFKYLGSVSHRHPASQK